MNIVALLSVSKGQESKLTHAWIWVAVGAKAQTGHTLLSQVMAKRRPGKWQEQIWAGPTQEALENSEQQRIKL